MFKSRRDGPYALGLSRAESMDHDRGGTNSRNRGRRSRNCWGRNNSRRLYDNIVLAIGRGQSPLLTLCRRLLSRGSTVGVTIVRLIRTAGTIRMTTKLCSAIRRWAEAVMSSTGTGTVNTSICEGFEPRWDLAVYDGILAFLGVLERLGSDISRRQAESELAIWRYLMLSWG